AGTGFNAYIWRGAWGSDGPINVGDLNGDGKADVFMWRGDTWTVNLSTGSGFNAYAWPGAPGNGQVNVGDINGDHKADAFVWNDATGTWAVNFSTGSGWLWRILGLARPGILLQLAGPIPGWSRTELVDRLNNALKDPDQLGALAPLASRVRVEARHFAATPERAESERIGIWIVPIADNAVNNSLLWDDVFQGQSV